MNLHLPTQDDAGATSTSDFTGIKDNDITDNINTIDKVGDVDVIPVKESAERSKGQNENSGNLFQPNELQPNTVSCNPGSIEGKGPAVNRTVKFDMKSSTTNQKRTSSVVEATVKAPKSTTVVKHSLRDPLVKLEAGTKNRLFSDDLAMIVHGEKVSLILKIYFFLFSEINSERQ